MFTVIVNSFFTFMKDDNSSVFVKRLSLSTYNVENNKKVQVQKPVIM